MQLHRSEGAATPKALDLLRGTDLGGPGSERTGQGLSDLHGEFGAYPVRAPVRLPRRPHHSTGSNRTGHGRSDLHGQFSAYPARFPVRLSGRSHHSLGRALHGRAR